MFEGHFQTFDLAEVLRLLSASSQTGILLIRQGNRQSSLSLQLGQLVDARCGDLSGLDALALLVTTLEGEFAFDTGVHPLGQSLAPYPTQQLIESIKQEITEQRALADALPSPDAVLRYVPGGALSGLQATPDELGLLLLADGRRTVRDIASAAGKELSQVRTVLARFRTAGTLEETTGGPAAAPPPPSLPSEGGAPRFWRGKQVS